MMSKGYSTFIPVVEYGEDGYANKLVFHQVEPCCWKCSPEWPRMMLCPECGNKRCPKASDHDLACTRSNEAGQPGSVYQKQG
jgi:hypothetical protein